MAGIEFGDNLARQHRRSGRFAGDQFVWIIGNNCGSDFKLREIDRRAWPDNYHLKVCIDGQDVEQQHEYL